MRQGLYTSGFFHLFAGFLLITNFQLLENDIFSNLSSPLYNDSRPPLSYILHILFNPLASDKETYRLSVLFISLIVPILLFFSIRKKYGKLDNYLICLLAIIVLLSPYFRTSAFWGLGENYGLIFLILSYLSFQKLKEKSNIKLADKYLAILNQLSKEPNKPCKIIRLGPSPIILEFKIISKVFYKKGLFLLNLNIKHHKLEHDQLKPLVN